jgi:hypothetical protein
MKMHVQLGFLSIAAVLVGSFFISGVVAGEVQPGAAVVRSLSGTVTCIDAAGVSRSLSVGAVVREGQTIRTGSHGAVDLFLAQNGPGLALEAGSELSLVKLRAWESPLGTLIETELDLREGQLYGTVQKLLPGSRYEVKTRKGVAKILGTEFYMDTRSGQVFVTAGVVTVTVVLEASPGRPIATRSIEVAAGQNLAIPNNLADLAAFHALAPVSTPPLQQKQNLDRLAQLGKLVYYQDVSAIRETFQVQRRKNGSLKVDRPPVANIVSP